MLAVHIGWPNSWRSCPRDLCNFRPPRSAVNLNQSRCTRNFQSLTSDRVNVLVVTDVAARGIHPDDISPVIEVNAPDGYTANLRRPGRTRRAGKVGTIVTLISKVCRSAPMIGHIALQCRGTTVPVIEKLECSDASGSPIGQLGMRRGL